MTRIFISHSHADREIASLLVDFLLAALEIRPEDIRCTSVPGHQLPFGTSIGEQLKSDLNKTTGLIALITKDSLRSTWVLFELGSGWATEKLVVPILGPGLKYGDLPGPLANYPGVQIEDENPSYRMTDVINQLASSLGIRPEINARREAKLNDFINRFKIWKSQLPDPDLSQQEKDELERSYQEQKQELQLQIEQLEQQLEQARLQASKQQDNLQSSIKVAQAKLTKKESENAQLLERISRLYEQFAKEVELKSEKGVDYTKLRDLLAAGKWQEADKETGKVMCQAAEREEQSWLNVQSIDNFPCEDLLTINQLWLHYSKGKFGFSVQKEIYESLGGTREYNDEVWQKFGDRVGWRKGENWLSYSDLTFNLNDPQAHLPSWFDNWDFGEKWSCLFSRVKTCNL